MFKVIKPEDLPVTAMHTPDDVLEILNAIPNADISNYIVSKAITSRDESPAMNLTVTIRLKGCTIS